MKIKSIIICLIIVFLSVMQAQATQYPRNMRTYLLEQKRVPSIRYDGIVVYNQDTMYIPVIPAHPLEVDAVKIVKTIPANQTIDKLPDLIVFNNNYSLIKVTRINENTLGAKTLNDLPEVVKTGLLPQDMMVPRGLTLPDNYAGILGDVSIPLVGSAKSPTFISGRKAAPLPTGKRTVTDNRNYTIPADLKNKLYFVNNFQTEYLEVFSSTVSEPLYSLKTSGVMKDVKPVLGGKFLLVATANKKNLDVIDVEKEYISKQIDLTALPSEIAVDEERGKAYVASLKDESLFVIDLDTMTMKEKIQLVGAPQRLSISQDGTKIAYIDVKSSNIYIMDLLDEYSNKLITNFPNTSKLILGNNVLYLIARTEPKLRIVQFDLFQDNKTTKSWKEKKRDKIRRDEKRRENADDATDDLYTSFASIDESYEEEAELLDDLFMYATSTNDIEIGTKPVDMYVNNGIIYVLCAGNNTVYSYNITSGELKSDKLPMDGFSRAFTPVPNSNLAIITNMADLKYVVYDLNKEKSVQTLPISEYINSITVLERENGK